MKKDIKLYDMIFPVWLLFIFPQMWLFVILGNFLIDSLVLLIVMKVKKIPNKKTVWKKSIIKIFLFGLIGDIAGGLCMIGISQLFCAVGFYGISNSMYYNPWSNIFALICTIICMVAASFVIYILDKKFAFNKTDIDNNVRKKIALTFAVFTAPILFLLPTFWFIQP